MKHRYRLSLVTTTIAALAIATTARAQQSTEPPRTISIGDAVRLAAQQNATALSAHYHTEEMDARARSDRAALLPSAGGSWADGQRSFNTASFGIPFPGFDPNGSVIGPVRAIDVRAHASATLLNPGGISEYRNAQAAASRADADEAATTEAVMASAASAYVRAMRGDAQVSARAADSSLAQELLSIAQDELRAGVGVALDVTRAQVQLAKVRSQLSAARNERDRARLELLRAAGLPLTTTLVLRDSLAMPLAAADIGADVAIAQALRTRSDLRAATSAALSTERAVASAHAEWLPTIGVFGDEGVTSAKYQYLRNTYTYGVELSIPFFEGGRRESRADERSAILRGAEARRHDLEMRIAIDVRAALLDLASAREQVNASNEGLGFADQAVAQARDRFRAGVAGSGDVISAQLDASTARGLLVDALTSIQVARISLARAQGLLATLP